MMDEHGNHELDDYDCEIDPDVFPQLDREQVEVMLRPYPELWEQWQEKLSVRDPVYHWGPGGYRQLFSANYLKRVIEEYIWLRDFGDQIDPEAAARCEEILKADPDYAQWRRALLEDPWSRVGNPWSSEPEYIACQYDPEGIAREVASRKRQAEEAKTTPPDWPLGPVSEN
jgi:hypothetical protein